MPRQGMGLGQVLHCKPAQLHLACICSQSGLQ